MNRTRLRALAAEMETAAPWIGVPEDLGDLLGMVYLITAPSGMRYVGKKLFLSSVTRKPLKGKKLKRHSKKESDWRTYFGSSAKLVAELTRKGPAGWRREVLHLCRSRWEMSYLELKEQLQRDALLRPDYWNSILHIRLNQPPAGYKPPGFFPSAEPAPRPRIRQRPA